MDPTGPGLGAVPPGDSTDALRQLAEDIGRLVGRWLADEAARAAKAAPPPRRRAPGARLAARAAAAPMSGASVPAGATEAAV